MRMRVIPIWLLCVFMNFRYTMRHASLACAQMPIEASSIYCTKTKKCVEKRGENYQQKRTCSEKPVDILCNV